MLKRLVIPILLLVMATSTSFAAEIHTAAAKGDMAKVKKLLAKKPALVNAKDAEGATPLHFAVASSKKAVVELLISRKAEVNAKKNNGVTPAHVAAAVGKVEIIKLLVSAKANLNAEDKKGRTPLDVAKENVRADMVEYLLANGAETGDAGLSSSSPGEASSDPIPPPVAPDSASQTPAIDEDSLVALATKFAGYVMDQQYDKAVAMFDDKMKQTMTPEKLADTQKSVVAQVGNLQEITGLRTTKVRGVDIAYATCKFEKATMDLQIAFDAEKRISGIYYVPPK